MPIATGDTNVNIFVGDNRITRIYQGDNLIIDFSGGVLSSPNPLDLSYQAGSVTNSPIILNLSYSPFISSIVDEVLSSGVRVVDVEAYAAERSMTVSEYLAFSANQIIPASGDMVAADNEIFTSTYHYATSDTYYGDLAADLDMSGVQWGRLEAGTLVTNQHVILAAHYMPALTYTLTFTLPDGTPFTRTVVGREKLQDHSATLTASDAAVVKLDSPVPAGAKIYPVLKLPSTPSDLIGATSIWTNQFREQYVLEVNQIGVTEMWSGGPTEYSIGQQAKAGYTSTAVVNNDSGHPSFIIVNREMAVIETLSTGAYKGPFYGDAEHLDALNNAINSLGY